jgi:hypothetical protein
LCFSVLLAFLLHCGNHTIVHSILRIAGQAWYCSYVNPATQEVNIGKMIALDQSGPKVSEIPVSRNKPAGGIPAMQEAWVG